MSRKKKFKLISSEAEPEEPLGEDFNFVGDEIEKAEEPKPTKKVSSKQDVQPTPGVTRICRPVVEPHRITSPYGWRKLKGRNGKVSQQMHEGIDYVSDSGSIDVLAIADGIVVLDQDDYDPAKRWTDRKHSAGNMLIVCHNLHGKQYYVRYLHLGKNTVSKGEKVERGQKIGEYGDHGFSFGPHLHVDMYDAKWKRLDLTPILVKGIKENDRFK